MSILKSEGSIMEQGDMPKETKKLFPKKEISATPVVKPKTIEDLKNVALHDPMIYNLLYMHHFQNIPLETLLIEYALLTSEDKKRMQEEIAFFHQTMSHEQQLLHKKFMKGRVNKNEKN